MRENDLTRQDTSTASGSAVLPELRTLIRQYDWSTTSLGPREQWPEYLQTTVSLILQSPMPMVVLWGLEGTMIYNDAYADFAGNRHPSLLGMPVRDAWPEVADFNDNVMREGFAGRTLSYRDQQLALERNGMFEDAWLNLEYSPVLDHEETPVGVLAIVVETTEKVRAESLLAQEQERLRKMFEQAPGFMAILSGKDHVFEQTNAAYMQLIGHRDILNLAVADALPDLEGQGYYELLDKVIASGEPFIGHAMRVSLQRTPEAPLEDRFVDFIFQPIKGIDGELSRIFVQGMDVTDRVNAERSLQESEQMFRSFAEAMPNHVWTAPPDGMLDWFNARVYAYSGAGEGELDGAGWATLVHPDDVGSAAERWTHSVATGHDYEAEFRLKRADGVYRWHIARAVLLAGEHAQPGRWIGTNTDIEDQIRIRQELADSERRLRLSQEAAGIASMEIDLATDRISGSAELWTLFGLPVQESAPANDFEALVVPPDRGACSNTESRREGQALPYAEYRIRRADDDSTRWISRSMEFLRDERGKPVRMFGALRDITAEKLAEERQLMLTQELEHRIKNILTTVSVIAKQTLTGNDVAAARTALMTRLSALGKAHTLLSNTHWTSAGMRDVVDRAVSPLPIDRIRVDGPAVELGPKRALALALAINELGTNSLKYGALSEQAGSVDISWLSTTTDAGEERLHWTWQEHGGPPVLPPTRRGFGRFLIEDVLAGDFEGTVGIKFDPTGVVCSLDAPWPTLRKNE